MQQVTTLYNNHATLTLLHDACLLSMVLTAEGEQRPHLRDMRIRVSSLKLHRLVLAARPDCTGGDKHWLPSGIVQPYPHEINKLMGKQLQQTPEVCR